MTMERARSLRKNATDAERVLWRALPHLRREGMHFRRQVTIGSCVADFACHRAKVIVELDGSQHAKAIAYDAKRTAFLEACGYRVLRFWNGEVLASPETVADFILAEARARLAIL